MRNRVRPAIGIAMALALLAAPAVEREGAAVQACGPISWYPLFTPTEAPDDPRFYEAHLGILQPGYRRRDLLVAFRTLSGTPLTPAERDAFTETARAGATERRSAVDTWLQARQTVPIPTTGRYIQQEAFVGTTYSYILNCGDSALRRAAETLEARRAELGAASPELAEWVRAQDMVFGNCSGVGPISVPSPLGAEASERARADRAYQIAAAELYGGRFADAEAAFTAIGQDPRSPWREWGPYLAARAMIRRGTVGADGNGEPAALDRARRALAAIASDPSRGELARSAAGLLQFVRAKTEPAAVLVETAAALTVPEQDAAAFARRLRDFEILTRRFANLPAASGDAAPVADVRESSELVDWIAVFHDREADALDRALARWDRARSDAWLVAALSLLPPGHSREDDLLRAAAAVSQSAPAYPTLAFHRARLLLLREDRDRARAVLDEALGSTGLPVSSVNLFKAARMQTARRLDDFVHDALRVPVGTTAELGFESTGPAGPPTFDRDAADVINERLPMTILRRLAAHPAIPTQERKRLLLAVFTRAVLLGEATTVRALVNDVRRIEPALRQALAPLSAAGDDRTLLDEGALLLLETPGLRPFVPAGTFRADEPLSKIDALRDNWWCGFDESPDSSVPYETTYWRRGRERFAPVQRQLHKDPNALAPLPFLPDGERRQAADEWQSLRHAGSGPVALGRRALAWADAHPGDPRAPRVLARIVRATRYGCEDPRTGEVSRAAFTRLHARYADSPWAARTPYWFK